jgi:hypothetical protein
MIEPQSCTYLVAQAALGIYKFVSSDGGASLFAVAATAKAIIYYCRRSQYPEAQELGATLTLGILLALWIAATEIEVPIFVKQATACGIQEKEPLRTSLRRDVSR